MQIRTHLSAKKLLLTTFFTALCMAYTNAQQVPALPPNQLILPTQNHEITFRWKGDTVNASWEPYAYMLIPVKLPGCPKTFFMQFDTGSPSTLFYKSKLKAIQLKYPKATQISDTSTYLQSFSFKAGNVSVFAKEIAVKQKTNTGINWSNKQGIEIIGTIGTDFIEDRVVIIDYPNQKIFLKNDIPEKLAARVKLSDFMFMRRSVLLPAVIKEKKSMLFFDSGSSAYELLTDKKTARSFAVVDAVAVTYPVQSWDRVLTANTFSVQDSIALNQQKIPIHHVTYMEGVGTSQVEQMMKLGIGGMTGNKLFIHHTLILDTKSNKFGLLAKGLR